MTNEKVLSKDEIDELLDGVGSEAQNGQVNNLAFGKDELKPLDFEHQERIIRGQFPVLERIYDRMIRNLTDELFLLFSREIEFEQEPFSIIKCREFLAQLETPHVINVYRFSPLRSKALFIFNANSIFEMVENYFGGHSENVSTDVNKELTPTEVRTVQMVSDRIIEKLEDSWRPIVPINITKIRTETSSQMLNIYAPADLLVTTRFKFSFGNEQSAFYIVLPYLMIDPIREQLELGASQSDQEDDPNWVNALKNELMNVKLEISSELAKKNLKLSDVQNWKVGDFIPLDFKETVYMKVEDQPLFLVKVGTSNDKCSLQIMNKVNY